MRPLVVILGLTVVVAAVAIAVLAQRNGSKGSKSIVFDAKVDGTYQLFTIDPDGGNLRQTPRTSRLSLSMLSLERRRPPSRGSVGGESASPRSGGSSSRRFS